MILGNIGPRTGLFGIVHVPRPELNSKLFVGAPVYLRDATFGEPQGTGLFAIFVASRGSGDGYVRDSCVPTG